MPEHSAARPIHVMAKPAGPACNLRCEYCFYLGKASLFPHGSSQRMGDDTLALFVRQYLDAQPSDPVVFSWQGGEPTLRGLDFYRRALDLQRRFGAGRRIENTLQTNGTLIDDEWAAFLKAEGFLVGISIDGPPALHDRARVDARGRGTSHDVLRGLKALQHHGVPFNTLTCVSAANADHPLEVYKFLKSIGSRHLQLIPVVERTDDGAAVTPRSVGGGQWGRFLIAVFDEWLRRDVGAIYVDLFELSLAKWLGVPGGLCMHASECGDALAIEHDGSVYPCDHFVAADTRLGSIAQTPLALLARGPRQHRFGERKRTARPAACEDCRVLFACQGGCPAHWLAAEDGERNHLCAGYEAFFTHVNAPMRAMAKLLQRGEDPARVMGMLRPAAAR